jgi:hypothetical protein
MEKKIILIFTVGFLFRIFLAIMINTYPESFYSVSSNDAIGFSMAAETLSKNLNFNNVLTTIKWNIYPFFLSIIYYILTPNIYIGSFFSVLIWSISYFVIYDSMKFIKISHKSIFFALIFFTFFPSLVIFTSITLRESFILLFLNLILNFFLKYYDTRNFFYLVLNTIFCLIIYFLHDAFVILEFIIFPTLYFLFFLFVNIYLKKLKIGYLFISLCLVLLIYNIDYLIDISLVYGKFNGFQFGATQYLGSASYSRIFYINNFYDFFYYVFKSFYKYMISPSIFDIKQIRPVDLLVIIENLTRIMIIILCIFSFRNMREKFYFFSFIFIYFFSIELTWSIGTFNWGTAIRHHACSIGILSILVALLIDQKKKIL